MTHADFRPKKRSGVVPSGKPRRKIPLLRILILIGVAFFIYLKFDVLWNGVRGTVNPAHLWSRTFGHAPATTDSLARPNWSADSTEFSLDCTGGLETCCEGAPAGAAGLCRQAEALVAKAQARRLTGPVPSDAPVRLFAREGVSRAGLRLFSLTALQTRKFTLRRNSAGAWCDGSPTCLTDPQPHAPLLFGRLTGSGDGAQASDTTGPRWVSGSSAVHAVLPGRIVAVDSVPGGARVRIYHGAELYTSYEPLHLPAGGAIKPGKAVGPGTVLGDAPWLNAGYTLLLRVRRAGLELDPADFFRLQTVAAAEPADSASSEASSSTSSDNTR